MEFGVGGTYYPAVDGVDLDVGAGEVVAIVGESGCGKTALAMAILKLQMGHVRLSGQALYNGQDILTLCQRGLERLRGREIGMVFQDPGRALNPVMRVGLQIAEAVHLINEIPHPGPRRRYKEAVRARVEELLGEVGLEAGVYDKYPHELSGGMRQRVVIAAALAGSPKLLIADEPTTALDVSVQAQILELLRELLRRRGMSILLVTHDIGVVAQLATRVAIMYAGQLVEVGPIETIFGRPHHPYTRALLDSLASLCRPSHRLSSVGGAPPCLKDLKDIQGCRFAPRLPMPLQHESSPIMRSISPGHEVRCICYREVLC